MPIVYKHEPDIAPVGAAAFATGQMTYQNQRRRELEELAMRAAALRQQRSIAQAQMIQRQNMANQDVADRIYRQQMGHMQNMQSLGFQAQNRREMFDLGLDQDDRHHQQRLEQNAQFFKQRQQYAVQQAQQNAQLQTRQQTITNTRQRYQKFFNNLNAQGINQAQTIIAQISQWQTATNVNPQQQQTAINQLVTQLDGITKDPLNLINAQDVPGRVADHKMSDDGINHQYEMTTVAPGKYEYRPKLKYRKPKMDTIQGPDGPEEVHATDAQGNPLYEDATFTNPYEWQEHYTKTYPMNDGTGRERVIKPSLTDPDKYEEEIIDPQQIQSDKLDDITKWEGEIARKYKEYVLANTPKRGSGIEAQLDEITGGDDPNLIKDKFDWAEQDPHGRLLLEQYNKARERAGLDPWEPQDIDSGGGLTEGVMNMLGGLGQGISDLGEDLRQRGQQGMAGTITEEQIITPNPQSPMGLGHRATLDALRQAAPRDNRMGLAELVPKLNAMAADINRMNPDARLPEDLTVSSLAVMDEEDYNRFIDGYEVYHTEIVNGQGGRTPTATEETPQVGFQPETQMGVAPQLREQPEGAPKPDPNESIVLLNNEIKTYHDSILQNGGDPQPQYEVGGLIEIGGDQGPAIVSPEFLIKIGVTPSAVRQSVERWEKRTGKRWEGAQEKEYLQALIERYGEEEALKRFTGGWK